MTADAMSFHASLLSRRASGSSAACGGGRDRDLDSRFRLPLGRDLSRRSVRRHKEEKDDE